MNPQLNEVPDLLLENSRAKWDSSHGVYADLSDLSRPKFYSKCPKCKHVHGFYTSLGDAVLKKICGACHFDNIEKLKRDLEKGDKPQKLKPGQKRKLPWPASVVKEAEEIDWAPDPDDPDASTASAAKLNDVALELARAGFAHEYTSHMGNGPRRSRWVLRANDAHSYTAEVEGKEWTLKHYIQERRGWPFRMTGGWKFDEARLISEISKIKSLFPPDVPESAEAVVSSMLESPEDIDWSSDPEDPDASTAMPLSCRLESSFDGDTMWFSLKVSNGKTYNCWSVDEAVKLAREHGFIWADGEPENNLVRKTLDYLGGLPESKEEEIDWTPDPEDPDANTAAAAKLPTDPEGALTDAGYTIFVERSSRTQDIYFWWAKQERVEKDGRAAKKRKSVSVFPYGLQEWRHTKERIEGPVCRGSIDFFEMEQGGGEGYNVSATLRGKYRATIEEALADIEHFDKTMGLVHGQWRLMHSGRVAEATEEIDWTPDPEDPDASTSATNQPLYWEVKLTFNFPSGPMTFWCDEGGPAASHTRLPHAIAKRVARKITSQYSPTSGGWTITSDQDPQAKLKADYKALVNTTHVEMFPSENQSQMHWQGRLWPQDFWPFEPVQETEDIDWSPDPDDPDASTSAAKYGKLEMLLKANGYESHHDGARLYYEKGKRGKRYVRVTFDSEYSYNPVEVRFAGRKSMEVPVMSNNKVWLYLTNGKEVILDQWLLEDAAYYLLHTFMYWTKSGKRPLRRESAERVACALLEGEDIDWSPDPEDPDASTAAVSKIPEPGIEIYNHHKYKVLTVTARQAAYLVANSYASEVSKSAYNAAGLPSDALFIHPLSDKTDLLIALRKAGLIYRTPNNRLPESEDIDWSSDPEDPDASQEHAYIARNQDPSELIRHALRDKLVEKGWRNIRVRQMKLDEPGPDEDGGHYYEVMAGVVDDLHRGEWLATGARVIPQPSNEHGKDMRALFTLQLRRALVSIGAKTADEIFVAIKPAYHSFDTQQQFDDFEDDHGDWNLEGNFHLIPGPKFWGKVSTAQGYEPPVPKTKEDRLAALKAEQEKRARYARTDNPVGADRERVERNAATKPEIDLSQLPPRDQWDGDTVHRFLTGESIVDALLEGEDIDWSEDPEDPDASTGQVRNMTELQAGLMLLGFERQPDGTYAFDVKKKDRSFYQRYVVRQQGDFAYLEMWLDSWTAQRKHHLARAWTRRYADAENLLAYLNFEHAEIFETVTHSPDEIAKEAEKAEEPKSEEHAEAGNYAKGHVMLDSEEEIDWSPDSDDPDASTSKHTIDFEPLLERNGFVRDTTTTSRRWAKSYRVDYPESAVGFEGTGVDQIQMCVAWGLDRPSRVVCAAQVWGDGQYRQSALANIYQDDNAGVVWFIQSADAQVAAATKATKTKKGFEIWKILQDVCSRMARDERHARDEETWRRLDPKGAAMRRVREAEEIDWSEDPEDPDSTTKAHTIDPALSLSSRGYRPLEVDSGLTAVERGSNGKRPMFKSYPVDYPQTEHLPADEIRVIITPPSDGTSALVGVGLYGRGQLLSIGGMLAWAYTQHTKGDWERILAVVDKADECVKKAFSLNVRPRDYAGTATGLWTALEDAFRDEMRQFDRTRSSRGLKIESE